MPVTKKKGAIFPIYADTPPRAGPSTSSSASSSMEKKVSSSRPALTALEPTATRPRPAPASDKAKASSSSSSLSKRSSRKMDIFADPEPSSSKPLASRPLSSKPQALSAKPLSTSLSKGEKKASSSRAPPASKRARSPSDKENAPRPAPDSPASRTRSKSRVVAREQGGTIISFQDKLAAVAAAKASANKAPTRPKTRKFAVLADAPLSDVSEAYGATAEEPAGFRDAPRPKPAGSARTRAMTTRSIRS